MDKNGPIIIIEDDADDRRILSEIFKLLNYSNEVIFLSDSSTVLDFFMKDERNPFLVISDVNMPKYNGLELKEQILNMGHQRIRSVPYIFFTTGADNHTLAAAYGLSVQGFFEKPETVRGTETIIRKIVDYWKECIAPA